MTDAQTGTPKMWDRVADLTLGWKGRGLAFLLGVTSSLGMAPLFWWPLTLLALALFMALLVQTKTNKRAFGLGWFFGFGHFVISLSWLPMAFNFQAEMPASLGWVALALLSMLMGFYPALASLAAKRIAGKKLLPFIMAFAGSWSLAEWLRANLFTGFAWNPLAEVALPMLYAFPARLVGTYGLSALLLLIAGALLLLARRNYRDAALAAILPLLLLLLSIGSYQDYFAGPPAGRGVNATLVQPNIGQDAKWETSVIETNFSKLAGLSKSENNQPRLLLWTEAAFPDYLEEGYPEEYYRIPPSMQRQRVSALLGPQDVLLTGALKLEIDGKGEAVGARNSIYAMDAKGTLLGRYDKSHLVPFGEYLPLRPILEPIGLSRLVPGAIDFFPGEGPQTLTVPGFGKAGLLICYEMIFSGNVADRNNRPDYLFSPSNDAWFGGWGAPQHHAQARLRAIEEGLSIARVTPTGISSVIDADGRTVASIAQSQAGAVTVHIPPSRAATPFARFGNVIPLLFGLILVLGGLGLARGRTSR